MEMGKQEKEAAFAGHWISLAQVFAQAYISIAEVDLDSGEALILKASQDPEFEGLTLPWDKIVERYAGFRAYPDDAKKVLGISLDKLSAAQASGARAVLAEVRCMGSSEGRYDWVEISAAAVPGHTRKVLITTKEINQERLQRRVVELFVYQSLDYLLVVDTKHNSYIRISYDREGVPLPLASGGDYEADMVRYNKMYVLPEDYERVTDNMRLSTMVERLRRQGQYTFPSGGLGEDGSYRWSRVRIIPYDLDAGIVLIARTDATQLYREEQAKNARLSAALRDAQTDALTGLYNKRAVRDLVVRSLENQYRERAAFLFCDIDNFKMVNDTFGHQKGDCLLREIGSFLKELCGRSGIAGRIGGDEFLLYLPGVTPDEAGQFARQICGALEGRAQEIPISCSVGISLYPQDGTDYEMLVRKADQALYRSKRYGKNRFDFYSIKAREAEDGCLHE